MTKISLKSWNKSSEPSLGNSEFLSWSQEQLFSITYMKKGSPLTEELVVSRANSMALLCKTPRGVTLLIDTLDVLAMDEIIKAPVIAKLVVRQLGAVSLDTVRQHLYDRHGYLTASVPVDPETALLVHQDHHGFNLGHRHPVEHAPLTQAAISQRTDELNAMYADTHECDSCGHIQNTDGSPFQPDMEGNRKFHLFTREDETLMHCEKCLDPDEFSYECSCCA